jgi:hypothetical protein
MVSVFHRAPIVMDNVNVQTAATNSVAVSTCSGFFVIVLIFLAAKKVENLPYDD